MSTKFSLHGKIIGRSSILIHDWNMSAFGDVQICDFRDIEKILTEDLNHNQVIEGILIENLFFVIRSTFKAFDDLRQRSETFKKRSILFKVKEGENFNYRHTFWYFGD